MSQKDISASSWKHHRSTSHLVHSSISIDSYLKLGWCSQCATFFFWPVKKLSTTMTSWPSIMSLSTKCDPTKPAPPVTTIFILRWSLRNCVFITYGVVGVGNDCRASKSWSSINRCWIVRYEEEPNMIGKIRYPMNMPTAKVIVDWRVGNEFRKIAGFLGESEKDDDGVANADATPPPPPLVGLVETGS